MTSEIRIELCGVPCIRAADGATWPLQRLDAAVLALVAVEGRVSRGRVADLLWPDRPAPRARNSLRQRLFQLHRRAGRPLVDGQDGLSLCAGVCADRPMDAVTIDPLWCTSPLLGDLDYRDLTDFDDWLAKARDAWRSAVHDRLRQAADALEQAGSYEEAHAHAVRLVVAEPLEEAAHRRVMRLLYLMRDRPAALEAFRRCRAVLAEELGVDPDRETLALAELIAQSDAPPVAPAAPPLALVHTPRLVGRERPWAQLADAWARRRVVLLDGEAGIGKSRLSQDFAAGRDQVVRCGARPGDATQPFALLCRLLTELHGRFGAPGVPTAELARLMPAFGPAPAEAADPLKLSGAIRAALSHWSAMPWDGLIVDDLHFADAASVDVLVDWLRDDASARVPQLWMARSGEWPTTVRDWRDADGGQRAVEITLMPLDAAGLRAMLDSLALPDLEDAERWAGRLWRHTGGHPLFALETLLACHQAGGPSAFDDDTPLPAPEGVGRLVTRRLAQLSPPARDLARVMAVAGRDSGPELLAAVLGRDVLHLVDAWNELKERGLAGDGGLAHDLIEATVQRSVPADIARVLHGRIGDERRALAHAPARVAAHFVEAGQWGDAAEQWMRAAAAAATQGRRDEEIDLLARAVDGFVRAGDADAAFGARLRRAETMMLAGSLAQALAELAQLGDMAVGDRQRLQHLLVAAKAKVSGADAGAALALAAEAQRLARQLGDAAAAFRAGQIHATAMAGNGQTQAALALLDELAPLAEHHADGRDRCDFHGTLGYVLAVSGRQREAAPQLRQAAELALALGDPTEAMTLWSNLAGTLMQVGDVAQGAEVAERAYALSIHAGERHGVAVGSNAATLGLAWATLGRFGDAERVLLEALQRFRDGGAAVWITGTEGVLANLYLTLGQATRARAVLSPVPPQTPAARRARRLIVQGRIEQAAGRSGMALFAEALALIDAAPQRAMDRIGTTLAWAQAAPPEQALPRLRAVRAECEAQGFDGMALTARAREADALRRHGDVAGAAACARDAADLARRVPPYDLYQGELWLVLFQAFEAAGDHGACRAVLAEAQRWIAAVLPHVPEAYRDAFCARQRTNARLLSLAPRWWPPPAH